MAEISLSKAELTGTLWCRTIKDHATRYPENLYSDIKAAAYIMRPFSLTFYSMDGVAKGERIWQGQV